MKTLLPFSILGWLLVVSLFAIFSATGATSKEFALYMLLLVIGRLAFLVSLIFFSLTGTIRRLQHTLSLRAKALLFAMTCLLALISMAFAEAIVSEFQLTRWTEALPHLLRWLLDSVQMDVITIVLSYCLALAIALTTINLANRHR